MLIDRTLKIVKRIIQENNLTRKQLEIDVMGKKHYDMII